MSGELALMPRSNALAGVNPALGVSVGSRQLTLPPDIEILVQALPRSVARAATSAPDPVIGSHRCQVVDT